MPAISGIDWASEWHDVRISDRAGNTLAERRFTHDEPGLQALIGLLLEHHVACVAIERPDGLLVGRLLAAGLHVLAIHPNQVAAARERFRAAAGKDDRFDAFVLCELARTDSHRFAALAPCGDETMALRILVRTREDLVEIRVHLANQLRAQLDASWPGARRIFADVDSPIGLAFLARYPATADTRGLGPKRLESFLARHGYAGRRTPNSSSIACTARRSPSSATSKPRRTAPPSWASSPRSHRSSSSCASSPARSAARCTTIPTDRSSSRSSKTPNP